MKKNLRRIRHGLAWEHNRELTETVRDSVGYNTKLGMFWAQLRRIGEALRLWAARSLWNEAAIVAVTIIALGLFLWRIGPVTAEPKPDAEPVPMTLEEMDRFFVPGEDVEVVETLEC